MVINYLLNGMILQVVMGLPKRKPDGLPIIQVQVRGSKVSGRVILAYTVIFHPKKRHPKQNKKMVETTKAREVANIKFQFTSRNSI